MDSNEQIECMRYAGKVNEEAIQYGFSLAVPGTTLLSINDAIESFILKHNCKPAFKDYQPGGANSPFPASVCLSPNDVVVHGVPNGYVIKDGDLLTIDLGTTFQGWCVDSARSRVIGINDKAEYLIDATEAILDAQCSIIKDECTFLQLIEVSEQVAKNYNITIMAQWGGHQIGRTVHMDPFIPVGIDRRQSPLKQILDRNKYSRQKLSTGQTICIEPVTCYGNSDITIDADMWTVRKTDGLLAAHTERCLLVLKDGFEILS